MLKLIVILETRTPSDILFAQLCSIEESFKSFKSRLYLASHVTRIKNNPKNWRENHNPCQQIKNVHTLNASNGFYEIYIIIEVMTE